MPQLRLILLFFLTGKKLNEEEEEDEEDDDDIDDDELRHMEELDSEDLGDDGDVGPVLQVNKVFIQNFIYDKYDKTFRAVFILLCWTSAGLNVVLNFHKTRLCLCLCAEKCKN